MLTSFFVRNGDNQFAGVLLKMGQDHQNLTISSPECLFGHDPPTDADTKRISNKKQYVPPIHTLKCVCVCVWGGGGEEIN